MVSLSTTGKIVDSSSSASKPIVAATVASALKAFKPPGKANGLRIKLPPSHDFKVGDDSKKSRDLQNSMTSIYIKGRERERARVMYQSVRAGRDIFAML